MKKEYEVIKAVEVKREARGVVEFVVKCEDTVIHIFTVGSDLAKHYKDNDSSKFVEASISVSKLGIRKPVECEADLFPVLATSKPRVRDNDNNIMYLFIEGEKLLVDAIEQEARRVCGLEHTDKMCFEEATPDTVEAIESVDSNSPIDLKSIIEALASDPMAATMISNYNKTNGAGKVRIMTYFESLVSQYK